MSEKEWLSALMDGDNEQKEKVDISRLSSDEQAHWANYHLIGDALRKESVLITDSIFMDRFSQALEKEPVHGLDDVTEKAPVLSSWWQRAKKTCSSFSWGQNLAQLAVAAGVSFLAISGVQWWSLSPEHSSLPVSSETPALSVLQTIPFMGAATPVSLNANSVVPDTEIAVREQRQRINALLQDYDLQLRLNTLDGSVISADSHPDNPKAE